jgi:RecA-family ATPase
MATVRQFVPRRDLMLSSWLTKPLPERDYLLGNVLSTTSRWLIFGDTGIGKTLFGFEIAGAVASGSAFLDWQGRETPRRVMYLDGEMPGETVKERMQLLAERYSPDLELWMFSRDVLKDGDMPPLNRPDGEKWLLKQIELIKPHLIGFDSVMSLLIGPMSEEESWAPMKRIVRQISSRRIGQIWMHHTGHDASKSFGTKTREWEMDTVIRLTKEEEGDGLLLEFTKARLRKPETKEQFDAKTISLGPTGWTWSGGGVGTHRKRTEHEQIKAAILTVYGQLADDVEPTSGFDGALVRKIKTNTLRDMVKTRGYLDTKDTGGLTGAARMKFTRAKADLIATQALIENEGLIWRSKAVRPARHEHEASG